MKTTSPGEFEVLPPERRGTGTVTGANAGAGTPGHQALSHLIAYLMDNVLKIPGTQKRIGLNPILDLIPLGFGDAAAALVQMFTIFEGARRGIPKIVLVRMALNVLLNGAVGTVPVVGEAFSWWYRPSSRNYDLLLKHAPQTGGVAAPVRKTSVADYAFVFGLLALVLVVMGMFIALGFYILRAIWHAL